ncbi:hypothetical protein C8R46DRAFT_376253 [Mycena filopes]|nr:hypothetical protein C8R46DRAFT_376253 [Mycena filopes]
MSSYVVGFGNALIATWLTILFCGVAFTQAVHYFARFPDDTLIRKSLVGVVVFLLVFTQAMECAETYQRLVTEWGDPAAFEVQSWRPGVFLVSGSLTAFIVDQFLIHRFYTVSNNMWIAVVLSLLNLVSLVMGILALQIFVSVVGGRFNPEAIEKIKPFSIVWGTTSAVTEVSIAACLVWTLRGMKMLFKETTQLIHHIMAVSVQNGCTTSLVSIAGMIASLVAPSSKSAASSQCLPTTRRLLSPESRTCSSWSSDPSISSPCSRASASAAVPKRVEERSLRDPMYPVLVRSLSGVSMSAAQFSMSIER